MKTQKRIEVEKNGDKYGKALSKFMNYAVYGKTMENLRKKMDVKLVSNERDYLNGQLSQVYVMQNIWQWSSNT